MTTKQLTPKQRSFITEFLVDLNQTQAAIRAGCTAKSAQYSARNWMKNEVITTAIQAGMNARAARTAIQADVALEAIVRIALKAEVKGDHGAALRGWELVGKHLRLFTDKVELTGQNGGPVEYSEIRRTIIDSQQSQT